jgi:pimeloyl-ACP methyl ester carboxylesterase
LVIVGYSEGSIVASKVLGILKKQPYACILLGSASLSCNCTTQSIEDFYMTDVLRRLKNWSDEQIKTELIQLCQIHKDLSKMNEEQFENKYKNSNPFGFGFAMWESVYIDREVALYDPVPNLLYANIPVLICTGEDDLSMPLISARKTYERLKNDGLFVTFRSIEKENHQYEKYDVFAIIDTWLSSDCLSTEFSINKNDSLIIEKYRKDRALVDELSKIPYGGG